MNINTDSSQDYNRLRGFLLGLVLALALMLAGLEYTSRPTQYDDDDEMLSDMDDDLEMMSPVKESDVKDMAPVKQPDVEMPSTGRLGDRVAVAQGTAPKAVTANVKVVDKTPETPDEVSSITSSLAIGNGEGEAGSASVTEALSQVPAGMDDTTQPQTVSTVEKLPEYPGGIVEFMKWLSHNLKYPPQARARKIQGKVVVSFIVNKNGAISNLKIEQHADPMLDAEALRVARLMPKWTPGVMDGKPCRTMIAIPINFVL